MFCVVVAGFFVVAIIGPGGVITILMSQGSGFCIFFMPGSGNSTFQKIPRGLPEGEGSGLELTDT